MHKIALLFDIEPSQIDYNAKITKTTKSKIVNCRSFNPDDGNINLTMNESRFNCMRSSTYVSNKNSSFSKFDQTLCKFKPINTNNHQLCSLKTKSSLIDTNFNCDRLIDVIKKKKQWINKMNEQYFQKINIYDNKIE